MKSPAWVLFRGLGREASHWGSFARDLGARFPQTRLYTPDFPGTGTRLQEEGSGSIEDMVNAVRSNLAFELVDRPLWLLGLSLGSMVALSWAQRFPAEVAGVALVSGSVGTLSPPWKRLKPGALATVTRVAFSREASERERQTLLITSANPTRQNDVVQEWTRVAGLAPVSRKTLRRQMWAAIKFSPLVAPLHCPTLVVAGAQDQLVDPDCSKQLARALGVEPEINPAAGHDVPLDEPEWLLQHLETWAKSKM